MKQIVLLEPYYGGSHKYWVDNIVKYSRNRVHSITMPSRYWKWRMKGASIYLSAKSNELVYKPDVFLCSTMMDVALFRSLLAPSLRSVPLMYYMHENQLTYPQNPQEERSQEDFHYGFSNISSCLAADKVIFNSHFHKDQFSAAALVLLDRLPDFNDSSLFAQRIENSEIIGVGIDFQLIDSVIASSSLIKGNASILAWNHRRSFDKDPAMFWRLCDSLDEDEVEFQLVLLGSDDPSVSFVSGVSRHHERIIINGKASTYNEYIEMLNSCTLLPISSNHDFYGISFLEAIYCGLQPILPSGLVYEEHLNPDLYENNFYVDEKEFINKVKQMVLGDQKKFSLPLDFERHDSRSTTLLLDKLSENIDHLTNIPA